MVSKTNYYEEAKLVAEGIMSNLEKIETTQKAANNLEERIGAYRINSRLMDDVKKDFARLEKIAIMAQRSANFGFDEEAKKSKEVDKEKIGYPGLKIINESLLKGQFPARGTTWKIIFLILSFLGIISAIFFFYNYAIEKRENRDALSGAATRGYFVKVINKYLWATSEVKKNNLYFLLIDIDNFKQINDNYGHDVGDFFIRSIGISVIQAIKNPLAFGRLGGDEFGVVVEAANQNDVTEAAVKLLSNFRQVNTKVLNKDVSTTLSIGITSFANVNDFHSLYKKADNALYRAKDAGRNTFSL